MSIKRVLNIGLLINLLQIITSFAYCQDSCFTKLPIKNIISNTIPSDISITENYKSEYFILDIKLDNQKDTIVSVSFFQKKSSRKSIKYIESLINKMKNLSWKNRCKIDRILIPIFILPLADNSTISDLPIELNSGLKIVNNFRQFIFETIVITTNDRIQ